MTQLPHSSTLSDLFGERRAAAGGLRGEAASSANGEGGKQTRASTLSSSASENRIVGEDKKSCYFEQTHLFCSDLEKTADDILAKYRRPRPPGSAELSPETSQRSASFGLSPNASANAADLIGLE